MKKIGILEFKHPRHGLAGLCRIANTKNSKVTVFTSRFLLSQVEQELKEDLSEYEWILKEENESDRAFLKRAEKICDDRIDLLFVNTIRGNCLRLSYFLSLRPKCKRILQIYNVNYWFKLRLIYNTENLVSMKGYNLRSIIKWFISTVDCNLGQILRRLILSSYDAIIVEYPPMKHYILKNFNYKKKIYTIPNFACENIPPPTKKNDKTIRFIVPGIIFEERRDYDLLLRVFEELFSKYNNLIEVCLLGHPMGERDQKIISYCEELKEKGYKVRYFKEWVPPNVFEDIFLKADVVISPLRLKLEHQGIKEIYSVTKGTGVTSDCIKYAKPLIVPERFKIADELNTSILTYRDAKELKETLELLIKDRKSLGNLQNEALANSKAFSLENLQACCEDIIKDFL